MDANAFLSDLIQCPIGGPSQILLPVKLANVPEEYWPPPLREENLPCFLITAALAPAKFPGAHALWVCDLESSERIRLSCVPPPPPNQASE